MMIEIDFESYEQGISTHTQYGKLDVSGLDECGFRPYFLMSSAIAGCATGWLRREMANRGLSYEDIKVKAKITRNPEAFNRIEKVHLNFLVYSKAISNEAMHDVIKVMHENSSMINTVKNSIEVSETFSVIR